jgi:type I restriction enzyme R subunit
MPRDELESLKGDFIRFSKTRRAVRVRYCDAIDNKEYEKQMQGLLDQHMRVAGLKQITPPVDILDETGMEEQLNELGTAADPFAPRKEHQTALRRKSSLLR